MLTRTRKFLVLFLIKGEFFLKMMTKLAISFCLATMLMNSKINEPIQVIEEPEEIIELVEVEEVIEEKLIFEKPISNYTITSRYGMRRGKLHKGIDLAAPKGTNIYASEGGTVKFAGWNSTGYGYLVIISHKDNYETYYAHCSKLLVNKGDIVEKGDLIAKVGSTGNSTGPHVHFEVRLNGEPLNPYDYIFSTNIIE